MLHSIRLALRNLRKNAKYTTINLVGMSVGMGCCFLILSYLQYEKNFDTFFPKLDRLYRISYHVAFTDEPLDLVRCPAPIGPAMSGSFPQVETAARLFPRSLSVRDPKTDRQFEVEQTLFADSTVQEVLGFDFLQGDPQTALSAPFSAVLTDETAQRIFGTNEVVGRQLKVGETALFTVTGVIRRLPHQSHLQVQLLLPFRNIPDAEPASAREALNSVLTSNWLASYTYTYVTLKPNTTADAVNAMFPDFIKKYGDPRFSGKQLFSLFPVARIHQYSSSPSEPVATANPEFLQLLGLVGGLILLISSINFINLSTAVYLDRSKEVAVRKALGATRSSLVGQLLVETMLLSGLAFIFAMGLLMLLIPGFNAQNETFIRYNILQDWPLTAVFAGIFVTTGLLAGLYPALFASRFKSAEVFQKNNSGALGSKGQWLRKSLITIQFSVSVALLCGTLIMQSQLKYWLQMPLGFEADNIIEVPLTSANFNAAFAPGDSTLRSRMNAFDDRLLQHPFIAEVTLASSMPGSGAPFFPVTTDKIKMEDNVFVGSLSVDYDFAETFKLKVLAGREFDKSYGTDHLDGYVINEMAVRTLGWESPEAAIGQRLSKGGNGPGKVLGVVKNFHTAGLQNAMTPLMMNVGPGSFTAFAIRLKPGYTQAVMTDIEKIWQQFFPGKAFEYHFITDNLQSSYDQESQLMQLVGDFAGVAIFLACFGLFGLVDFSVRQRRKEIGIRKVLGASIAGVTGLLAKDFLRLVLLSFVFAFPVAYWLMQKWLAGFAYPVELQWWMFATAGFAAVLVAFITVSFQSVRAALADPVKSLRSE